MMNMEFNKVAGAVLLAGLIAMMSGFIAEQLVKPHEVEKTVYPTNIAQAPTATGSGAAAPAAGAAGPVEPVTARLASADPAAGQKAARVCATCHTFEKGGANKVGPNLWNIVDAPHARAPGFSYSPALQGKGGTWTYEDLNRFLANPKAYAPGTKMTFAGVKDPGERASLIAWLRTQADTPAPLP